MTIALRIDPHGYLDGYVDDLSINPAALIAGIDNYVRILLGEGPLSPDIQFGIQLHGELANSGRRKLLAHQLLGNPLHLACGDPLQVGLCQSQNQGFLTALVPLQDRRIELAVTGLGNLQDQRPNTCIQRPGLKSIALAATFFASLVAANTDMFVSLQFH